LQKLFATIKRSIHNRCCRLKLLWADAAYAHIVETVRKTFGWNLEIVRRSDQAKGFEVLPHRWIVERTFAWLGRYRRLARDFEHTVSSSEAVVYIASIRRMLKLATN
jgi:putative transposase